MPSNTIKESFKALITNRYLTVLSLVTIILSFAFVIYIIFAVRPSELQLVTHYTAYGVTHLYRSQWYYLFTFGGIAILIAFLHISVAVKLFLIKGRPLAIMFAWMGIGVLIFAWVVAYSIINVWSPV